jgi:hypothetical protein
LVDALVESADGQLTGEQGDAVIESAMAREYHLKFEVGRRADWALVEQGAAGRACCHADVQFRFINVNLVEATNRFSHFQCDQRRSQTNPLILHFA